MYATRAARVATCDLATESGSRQTELRKRNISVLQLARLRVQVTLHVNDLALDLVDARLSRAFH